MLIFWLLQFQEWCHSCRVRYFLGRLFSVPIDVTRFAFTHGGQVTTIVIFLHTNICVLFPHFSANERAHNFFDIRFLIPPAWYRTILYKTLILSYLETSGSCNSRRKFSCKSFFLFSCMVTHWCNEVLTFHFLLSSALVNHIMTPRYVIFIIGLGWQMRTLTIVDVLWLFLIICPLEISMLLKTERTSTRDCHVICSCLLWRVSPIMTCLNKILHNSKSLKSCNQEKNNLH